MALIQDYERYNRLATVFNGTFGSTGPQQRKVSTQSVKFELIDENTVKVRYMTIVNFPSHALQRDLARKYRQDGLDYVRAALDKSVEKYEELHSEKEGYKKLKWKLDENALDEGFEFLHNSAYAPVKRAYFRIICVAELS